MRFLRTSLTGLFLLSLTLGLFVYAGQIVYSAIQERIAAEAPSAPRSERVFVVNTVEGRLATETPTLLAFGEVISRRTLEIRARTGGTLVELAPDFEDGGRVEEGQLLARIDPADAQFALDRAQSDVTDAEAEEREAERGLFLAQDDLNAARAQAKLRDKALTRQLDLQERGVGTTATVEQAELEMAQADQTVLSRRQALAVAEARVDQAQTQLARSRIALAEAKKRFEDTRIVAGFSGTLGDVSVVEGRFVSANEKLADLVDSARLDVAFRLSTSQHTRLLDETGRITQTPITARLDVFGVEIESTGRITRDSGSVEDGQTGRLVFAQLDSAVGFKPGDFVTVEITEPPLENVVRLPATALGADGRVLIVGAEDRLETRVVTLLRRQGNEVLVRGNGLEGQRIVAQRTPLLGPGLKVRVIEPLADENEQATASFLEISDEHRARLQNFVQSNTDMPEAVKQRLQEQLTQPRVPARVVERLERRMGG